MIKKVEAYQTEDGCVFLNETNAIDWEIETKVKSIINAFVFNNTNEDSVKLADFIINHRAELFKIFKEELE